MNALAAQIWDAEEGRKVQEFLFSSPFHPSRAGQVFSIPRPDGRPPLLLWVTPLDISASGDRAGCQVCLIHDLERQPAVAKAALESAYRFTRAEIRLAEQLLLGRTPAEAAQALGVTIYTVRTYLKRLYHKVGAKNQATLVRRLIQAASLPAPIAA